MSCTLDLQFSDGPKTCYTRGSFHSDLTYDLHLVFHTNAQPYSSLESSNNTLILGRDQFENPPKLSFSGNLFENKELYNCLNRRNAKKLRLSIYPLATERSFFTPISLACRIAEACQKIIPQINLTGSIVEILDNYTSGATQTFSLADTHFMNSVAPNFPHAFFTEVAEVANSCNLDSSNISHIPNSPDMFGEDLVDCNSENPEVLDVPNSPDNEFLREDFFNSLPSLYQS